MFTDFLLELTAEGATVSFKHVLEEIQLPNSFISIQRIIMSLDVYSCIYSPQAQAVIFVAHELGINLNIKPIALEKAEHKSLEFLKVGMFFSTVDSIDFSHR